MAMFFWCLSGTLYNSMELHIDPSLDILWIDAWGRSIFVGVDTAARAPVLVTQGCIKF